MTTYYVFQAAKIAMAEAMLPQRQGQGFFDFKIHNKKIKDTALPLSSLQPDSQLTEYRPVLILETDFADEDAAIRTAAEAEAEFYSTEAQDVLNYLNQPDNV